MSSIYRSPTPCTGTTANDHLMHFLNHLEQLMHNITATKHQSYICLDSNINTLHITDTNPLFEYYTTINTCGFVQCISKATRIHNASKTLIDHIITNTTAEHISTGVIITDISDHFATFVELGGRGTHKSKPKVVKARSFSKKNVDNFKKLIKAQNWDHVLNKDDIDESYDCFWNTFKPTFDLCFPLKTRRFNKNTNKLHPHMTHGLLKSRSTKIQLHKKALKHPTPEHISKYKEYRNIYNRLIKASKKLYFNRGFEKAKRDPRRTWSLVREALNTNQKQQTVEKIVTNNGVVTSHTEMAEAFNDFFVSAGQNVANSVPPTSTLVEDFLPPPIGS